MKRLAILAALCGAVIAADVRAQQEVVVNYDTATLAWDYTAAEQGMITAFSLSCVRADAQAWTVPNIAPSARSILIRDVIPGPGRYSCLIFADAGGLLSDPSNSAGFGVKPVAVINLRVEGGGTP